MTDDPFFGAAWVDVDEWRDEPLRHRYVHGGFTDTDTRFSLYFPPADLYQQRLLQFLEGGHGGSENAVTQRPGGLEQTRATFLLAFEEFGAFLVESNQGHIGNDLSGLKGDWTITWYRASAQTAKYARQVAAEMYGMEPRHTYVYGPSGGGIRSFWCLENAADVYDGALPYVISPIGLYTMSAHAYGVEGVGDKLTDVVDATEPGGSGDPFAGLTTSEREALTVLYRTGWARRAESQLRREYIWGFGIQDIHETDPSYLEDFWTKPGYAGADDPAALRGRIAQGETTVRRVVAARDLRMFRPSLARASEDEPIGVVLDVDDADRLFYAKLTVTSGMANGRTLYVGGVDEGGVLIPFTLGVPELFSGVEAGDTVRYDNRDYVAYCHYHRHIGVDPERGELAVDGHPMYPRRLSGVTRGMTGRIGGKMILCPGALDSNVFPTDAYPRLVARHLGDRVDDFFRMWWMDNASHGSPTMHRPGPVWETRLMDYTGIIEQGLRDLIAWVEEGRPPAKMQYGFSPDNALWLPETAAV
jgi:hypothetical protein